MRPHKTQRPHSHFDVLSSGTLPALPVWIFIIAEVERSSQAIKGVSVPALRFAAS